MMLLLLLLLLLVVEGSARRATSKSQDEKRCWQERKGTLKQDALASVHQKFLLLPLRLHLLLLRYYL